MSRRKNIGVYGLALGALGVVFGDIGTSPLYAIKAIFEHGLLAGSVSQTEVYGIVSLIIWSITLVVSIKYIGFVMRANNAGEGGIMALVTLLDKAELSHKIKRLLILLGVLGVALFYGDSMITPAISVLSAVEGVQIVAPSLHAVIVPVTLVVLAGLFLLQQKGTGFIGKLFGPVMFVWFVVLAAGGLGQIVAHPTVLQALSPWLALQSAIEHPAVTFIALAAVVLTITGAEALYADMGHFGRKPIALTWFWLVFPALALNYMGQAALIVHNPASLSSPFYLLYPSSARVPLIGLAMLATLIASQAVISGAFSLTHQAVQLRLLPRLMVKHTSDRQFGQIYLPMVNRSLFVLVLLLVVGFGSSAKLASAYGIAVSGTLAIDSILFLAVARFMWHKPKSNIVLGALLFLGVDLLFTTSNLSKVQHGGWLPILLASVIFMAILTWIQGQEIITKQRMKAEGKLEDFVQELRNSHDISRLPGSAVYLSQHVGYTPLALRATVDRLHELHEHVVIVNINTKLVPHVAEADRITYDALGYQDDGISHITLSFGFKDALDVPHALRNAQRAGEEVGFDLSTASYFVSTVNVVASKHHNLAAWKKALYMTMSKNTASPTDYYRLPLERTVEMSSYLNL